MRGVEGLIAGYRDFRSHRYAQQSALFQRLARGQSPSVMVVACADSRADPSMIFSAAPGELFVVRNVANLVPPYEEEGRFHGTSAALEFAVLGLKVTDIMVMGHASCGGIDACLGLGKGRPVGRFIGPWVSLLDDLRDRITDDRPDASPEELQFAMEQAAVAQSIENITSYPFAADAIASGKLAVHGAWFSIASGELHMRDAKTGRFEPVPASA